MREYDELKQEIADLRDRLKAREEELLRLTGKSDENRACPGDESTHMSDAVFRAVFEHSLNAMIIADDKGNYRAVNPAAAKLFGRSREELSRMNIEDLVPDRGGQLQEMYREYVDRGIEAGEFPFVLPDGSKRLALYHAVRLASDINLSILSDITERKEREGRLYFQSLLLNQIRDHITATDLDGNITYVNRAVEETLGKTAKDLIGANVAEYGDDPARGASQWEIIERTRREGSWRGEVVNHTPEGEVIFDTRTSLFHDEEGKVLGMVGISTDITAKKRVEEKLRLSLKEKETLLRELLHRTRNNMQVISSMLQMKAMKKNDAKVTGVVDDITSRIHAIALVHQMLYGSDDLSTIHADEFISRIVHQIANIQDKESNIRFNLNLESLPMSIDIAIPVGLILNELINNSMKHGFTGNQGQIDIILARKDNNRLSLEYRDNGKGLPENFDPSTGEELGLQTVISMAKHQLGGELDLNGDKGFFCKISFDESIYSKRV